MTSLVTKYAAKKLLGKQMDKYKDKNVAGDYDPYYMLIPNPKRPGKFKKVKRQIPDYIPDDDAMILSKARRRAYYLDMALFNFCGIRFGWSSVFGLIPAIGDVLDAAMALALIWSCSKVKCKLGKVVILQMVFNLAFDFLIGIVPFVGDLADAAYKCNSRNVRLLEERLDRKYKPGYDEEQTAMKGKKKKNTIPPATLVEDFSDDDPFDTMRSPEARDSPSPQLTKPQAARVPAETRGGERSSHKKGRR